MHRGSSSVSAAASEGPEPNRAFDRLLTRFVEAVSSFARRVSDRDEPEGPPVDGEGVRRAARKLGAHLSQRVPGVAHFLTADLERQTRDLPDLLGEGELRAQFGAATPWQVVERVAETQLGATVDVGRARSMAESGGTILDWLAERSEALTPGLPEKPLLDVETVRECLDLAAGRARRVSRPLDCRVLRAVETWLGAARGPMC